MKGFFLGREDFLAFTFVGLDSSIYILSNILDLFLGSIGATGSFDWLGIFFVAVELA